MRFYFPDSQDLVSPTYDFVKDEYSPLRVRQRDDRYAHEVLHEQPYHGLLVSKSIVDGSIKGAGKYTGAQRARLYRLGVRKFFRLPADVATLGDNGAFNYADELEPPVTVDETLDFYEGCGFDAGVSVDHIIFGYEPDATFESVDPAWAERRLLTLRLAEEFIDRVATRGTDLEPVGAAQGWSPASYADSVKALQDLGYRRIALGGMVPLKTHDILACLEGIDAVRKPETEFHLLGITRVASMGAFAAHGVTSFDSTSAFRQAFMDDRLNYHTTGRRVRRHPRAPGGRKPDLEAGRPGRKVSRNARRLRASESASAHSGRTTAPTPRSVKRSARSRTTNASVRARRVIWTDTSEPFVQPRGRTAPVQSAENSGSKSRSSEAPSGTSDVVSTTCLSWLTRCATCTRPTR